MLDAIDAAGVTHSRHIIGYDSAFRSRGEGQASASEPAGPEAEELVQAILKEAQARKQAEGIEKVLLPMRNKDLLQAVQRDVEGQMVQYEDNTYGGLGFRV